MASRPPVEHRPRTLLDALDQHAERDTDRRAFEFAEDDGSASSVSFGDLAERIDAMAARVASVVPPGGRALVLYPPGIEYIVAVCAAMAAHAVPVPAYPPTSPRHLPRLRLLLESCRADAVLASDWFQELEAQLAAHATEANAVPVPWLLGTDGGHGAPPPRPGPDDVALVQYTSGSTSAPRGVVLSHAVLASNLAMIQSAARLTSDDVGCQWLPPYHDMGLIGGIFEPLFVGYRTRLMSPLRFIRDPLGWLRQISEQRATIAGGPNFGYDRCVRRLAREAATGLDLSAWQIAFTGAEPVRAGSLDRFAAAFGPSGFRADAFFPCYGLAEATLMVSGAAPGSGAVVRPFSRSGLSVGQASAPGSARDRHDLVSCGRPVAGVSLRITDEHGVEVPGRTLGEIRVQGPNVALGYLGEGARLDTSAFSDAVGGREFATRDIGFLDDDGELFVCGRASDLIIVRGRNVHPEDVEAIAETALGVPGPAIAFGIDADEGEDLVVLREVKGLPPGEVPSAAARVRSRVGEVLGVQPAIVRIVGGGELPRTSSGKVQRAEARELFIAGRFGDRSDGLDPTEEALGDDALATLRRAIACVLDVGVAVVDPAESPMKLGLDSLGAVEVSEALEDAGLAVSPTSLIDGSSVAEAAALAVPFAPPASSPSGVTSPIPSLGEQAIWFHEQVGEGPSPYVLTIGLEVGAVDPATVRSALVALVARHDALRTAWVVVDGVLERRVAEDVDVSLAVEGDPPLGDDGLAARVAELGAMRLDPGTPGGLLRATLIEVERDRWFLHLAVHHLVADHDALRLLMADLADCHDAELAGQPAPPVRGDMGALAAEERRLLAAPEGVNQLAEWVDRLASAPPPPMLPGAVARPSQLRFDAHTVSVPIDDGVAAMVQHLARAEGTTPFVVLAACVHTLLHRLTGEQDIVIGSPTSRRRGERRNVVGLVMNVLPLRVEVEPTMAFRDLVRREHQALVAARRGEEVPLVRIIQSLNRSGRTAPLYSTMLTVLDGPAELVVGRSRWRLVELEPAAVAVDLAVEVRVSDGSLSVELRAAQQVFDERAVASVAQRLAMVIAQTVAIPDQRIEAITMMGAAERRHVLELGSAPRPVVADVFAQFREYASQQPDAVAVRADGASATYGELYRSACRLAADLQATGEDLVVVHLRRSGALITTMLASLAAGIPWVPLDPDAPASRAAKIVAGLGARVVITDCDLPPEWGPVQVVDPCSSRDDAPEPGLHGPTLPAYVMHTSGSSGHPKGVAVPRGALSATLAAVGDLDALKGRSRVLANTNVGFDISVLELLLPFVIGGSVVVGGPDGVRSPDELLELIEREQVDVVQATPSTFAILLELPVRLDGIVVLCGGEAAPPGLFRRLRRARADAVINVYGPTETTIWSTAHEVVGDEDPPLGAPLAGETVHLLDHRGSLLPIGVEGEVCIGGTGVAIGYVGRPRLTAERFIPDPFAGRAGARMYRTGDVARRGPSGQLEFLGRYDDQVKVRGVRIECSEVAVALQEHSAVRRAVVRPAPGPDGTSLTAVLQWTEGATASQLELRAFLADRLLPEAIPSTFRSVDEFPVTDRGKLDTNALASAPLLEPGGAAGSPATPTEVALASVWKHVLGVEEVGPSDDFFSLGGHSLLGITVVEEVAVRMDRRISIADVIQAPILSQLAERIDAAPVAMELEVTGVGSDLTGAQRRIWLAERVRPGTADANISLSVELVGPLQVAALRDAVNAVVRRHEELRAVFPADHGRPTRSIQAFAATEVAAVDVPADDALRRLHEAIARPFDLDRGPLVRVTLLRTAPSHHLLALTAHHIVVDGAAAGVLLHEIGQRYNEVIGVPPADHLQPAVPFAAIAARQATYESTPRHEADLAWWCSQLAGAPRRALPRSSSSAAGSVESASLGETLTSELRRRARRIGTTPFVVVAAAVARSVTRHVGLRSDLVLGVDVSGRDEPGVAGAVGPIVNQVCLRIDATTEDTAALVGQTQQVWADAIARSKVSYDRVVAAVAEGSDERSLFDVKLAFQPAAEEALDLAGVEVAALPRAPLAPTETVVVFVREGTSDIVIELQHRVDALPPEGAARLLSDLLHLLAWLAHDQPEEPLPTSRTEFTRRSVSAIPAPTGRDIDRPHIEDPTGPAVVRAGADVDLPRWVADHRALLAELLTEHGALLFRGFGVDDPSALRRLVVAAGQPVYHSTEHDRTTLAPDVYTPIPYSPRERLLWHNEDTFRSDWPARLWFACRRPADEGGATTLADSRRVARALGEVGGKLGREGMQYVRRFGDGLGHPWQAVFATDDPDEVVRRCSADGTTAHWDGDRLTTVVVRPSVAVHPVTRDACWVGQLLHFHPAALSDTVRASLVSLYGAEGLPRDCRQADGTPIPDATVDELVAAYASIELDCQWERGDVLVVDNLLMAHGRRPYAGTRELLVAMTSPSHEASPRHPVA